MARRPNYGAEKRSKELNKQRKREEKEEKKRARREAEAVTRDGELDVAAMTPTGAPDAPHDGDDADDG